MSLLTKNILDQKSIYLIVCLIGTTLTNILTSSFATAWLINLNIIDTKIIFIPIAAVILLFGEILPKSIMQQYANLKLLDIFNLSKRKLFIERKKDRLNDKRKEIESVFDQNDETDTMEPNEKEIITNIFEYSKITVQEAMTPRIDVSAISSDCNLNETAHKFIDSGHSKLPVYRDNIDNIIGIIYIYDL